MLMIKKGVASAVNKMQLPLSKTVNCQKITTISIKKKPEGKPHFKNCLQNDVEI